MTTLDKARETLTWAANRLAAAHAEPHLPDAAFAEVLDTYMLATRAYHHSIRETNKEVIAWHKQQLPKSPA